MFKPSAYDEKDALGQESFNESSVKMLIESEGTAQRKSHKLAQSTSVHAAGGPSPMHRTGVSPSNSVIKRPNVKEARGLRKSQQVLTNDTKDMTLRRAASKRPDSTKGARADSRAAGGSSAYFKKL